MKSKEKTLRVSLFFDTVTNENDKNQNSQKSINSAVALSDDDLMQTNILRLFCNLTKKTDNYHKSAYIAGANLINGANKKQSDFVTNFDRFKAESRTQIALKNLLEILATFCLNHQNINLTLKIDLFGFSSGAALARNFANLLNSEQDVKEEISFLLAKNENTLQEISFGFLGLFDTIKSDLGTTNNINLNLNNIKADATFHLTALHEIREKFPLQSVKNTKHHATSADLDTFGSSSNRVTNTFEFAVPGSHTDIGGGCELFEDENYIINPKPTYNAACLTENIHNIIDSHSLLAPLLSSIEFEFNIFRGGYTAINRRKNVYGHLQLVYARLMVDTAVKFGVPFDVSEFEKTHAIPTELNYFYSELTDSRNLLLNVKKFNSAVNVLDAQLVQKYVHLSSSAQTSAFQLKKKSKVLPSEKSSAFSKILSRFYSAIAEFKRKLFMNNEEGHLEQANRYY